MEKYKDLIVTLIKNHRRYPGCEGIIDKIVEEVNSKAETVIENVQDETTVRNYLIKAVSAAMIVVPKRHNINTHMTRRSEVNNKELLTSLNKETVAHSNTENEPLALTNDTSDTEVLITDETDSDSSVQEIEEYNNSEDNENIILQDYIEDEPLIKEDDIDEVSDENIINEENDNSIEIAPENLTTEESIENDTDDSATSDISFDNSLVDRMINEIEPEDTGIITPEPDNFELEEIDNLTTEGEKGEEEVSKPKTECILPDYSIFNNTERPDTIDVTEFKDDLLKLFNDNPDRKYNIIWKLKYLENKSITEIADILDIEIDDVLSGLDEILDVIEG